MKRNKAWEERQVSIVGARFNCYLGTFFDPDATEMSLVMKDNIESLDNMYSFDWTFETDGRGAFLYKNRSGKILEYTPTIAPVNGINCILPALADLPLGGLHNIEVIILPEHEDACVITVGGSYLIYKFEETSEDNFSYTPYILYDESFDNISDFQEREDNLLRNNLSSFFLSDFIYFSKPR